jgi:hypothetical protein
MPVLRSARRRRSSGGDFGPLNVRDASLDELKPQRQQKEMTARQRAIFERDEAIRRLLDDVSNGPQESIKAVELGTGQKLPTMRSAFNRVIRDSGSNVHMAIRGTTIYLSLEPLPGGRGRRPKGNG